MCACTYIISLCNQKVPNNVGNEDSNIIIMRKKEITNITKQQQVMFRRNAKKDKDLL
uniref:Uncharacterized protein n=1 Tax=Rhizophagus irregularis (strain DAOM 181602 / DAOM 197198 / MUCL 43194) TaxID=747089 RepID=U9TF42_RHIID